MYDIVIIGGHGKVALLTAPMLVESGSTVTSVISRESAIHLNWRAPTSDARPVSRSPRSP